MGSPSPPPIYNNAAPLMTPDPSIQSPYGQQPIQYAQPQALQPMQPMPVHPSQMPPQQPQMAYAQPGQPQMQHQQGYYAPQPQTQPMHSEKQNVHSTAAPVGQAPARQYQNATPLAALGRSPAPVDCPACGQRNMTRIAYETGNTTHAWAAGLCCFFCLGCIPYMMNSMKDVRHQCGNCGVHLATWHKSGSVDVHQHS